MTYSSLNGGLNKVGSCAGFIPLESPNINSTVSIVAPDVTNVTMPPAVTAENIATCGDITLTSTAGTWITCTQTSNASDYHKFDIKVGNKSSTPIKWDVSVDIKSTKAIKIVDTWSQLSFESGKFYTPTFNIKGLDKSWNNDPLHSINNAYTYDTKTHSFTIGITWK